jgi:hypothetical protein
MKHQIKFPDEPRKCGGKNCYQTKTEAEKVKHEQELLNANKSLRLKVYRCDCGAWHLTSVK